MKLLGVAVAFLLSAGAGSAGAATFSLSMNGTSTFGGDPSCGIGAQACYQFLSGSVGISPFTMQVGDTLQVTVTFPSIPAIPNIDIGRFNFFFSASSSSGCNPVPCGLTGFTVDAHIYVNGAESGQPFIFTNIVQSFGRPQINTLDSVLLVMTLITDPFGSGMQISSGLFLSSPFGMRFDGMLSSVPLPTALPLFATGLGVLGLLGWRRKRKAV